MELTRYHVPTGDVPPQAIGLLRNNQEAGYIAGGYARWVFANVYSAHGVPIVEPGDVDFFLRSPKGLDVMAYSLASAGYEAVKELPHAIEYHYVIGDEGGNFAKDPAILAVQVIKPHMDNYMKGFGTPEDLFDHFDFRTNIFALVCETSIDDEDEVAYSILTTDQAIDDSKRKRLVVQNINDPIALVHRAVKYAKKGYSMSRVEVSKIFEAWDERTPDYHAACFNALVGFRDY